MSFLPSSFFPFFSVISSIFDVVEFAWDGLCQVQRLLLTLTAKKPTLISVNHRCRRRCRPENCSPKAAVRNTKQGHLQSASDNDKRLMFSVPLCCGFQVAKYRLFSRERQKLLFHRSLATLSPDICYNFRKLFNLTPFFHITFFIPVFFSFKTMSSR